jgi:OmpA-OmpF porin, OOP family
MHARHRSFRGFTSTLAFIGATALAASAAAQPAAQDPIALQRFEPAPAGDRFFGVPSPFAAGDPDLHLMLLGDYAHNPLVLSQGDEETSIVEHQLIAHLNATLALWNRLHVNIDVPVALLQSGESPTVVGGSTFTSPSGAEFGDLRAGLRLRLVGEYHDPFQLGLGGYIWFPTAGDGGFLGNGSVRGQPQLLLGGRIADRVVWSLAGGPEFRDDGSYANVAQGRMLTWGAGIGFLLGDLRRVQIGPELLGTVSLEDVNARTTNLEGLLGLKWRFVQDMELGAAVGPGFTSGVGTPDVRAVFSLAYTPEQPKPTSDRDNDGILDGVDACPDEKGVPSDDPKKNGCPPPVDTDKDGIFDDVDACPKEPGVADPDPKKNGCPVRDRDKDGILDGVDACPDEKGVANEDPKKNGCPPPGDKDGDGVTDDVDACIDLPGVKTEDPKTNGCPPDTDGDGIRDDLDACPKEKGPADPDPKKNGCPKIVLTDKEIVILEQVQFDFGKATIKPESDSLLGAVADVLKEHPEITKIEVQGHTDNVGGVGINKKLSQSRADSVKAWLVAHGVEATRLTSIGYGLSKPIADNKTDEGRAKNRRVQFTISEKKQK